jgi:3-oxoacyl-[acyl-carrier protein] reductase
MPQCNRILDEKIAIVTGGASGLGLAIANTLADAGSKVVIFDRDSQKLQLLFESFQTECVDVTDEEAVQRAVDHVVERYGRVDILVNNAGIIYNEPFINITKKQRRHDYEVYKKIIDINMHSVFLMSSIVADHMILKRTAGVIVNISSISAAGNAGQTAYSAAKAGVNAFTKTWAKELGPFGIRVVAVAPGFIKTQSTQDALNSSIIDALIKKIPLRKLGSAIEVAQMVLAVVSNSYMSGAIVMLDGGVIV